MGLTWPRPGNGTATMWQDLDRPVLSESIRSPKWVEQGRLWSRLTVAINFQKRIYLYWEEPTKTLLFSDF